MTDTNLMVYRRLLRGAETGKGGSVAPLSFGSLQAYYRGVPEQFWRLFSDSVTWRARLGGLDIAAEVEDQWQ